MSNSRGSRSRSSRTNCSAEEVIARALEALKQEARLRAMGGENKCSPLQENAVREMLAFVEKNHVRLSGVSVKDLIHEGHRL